MTPEAVDRAHLGERLVAQAMERYDAREQELGEELMGQLERFLLLQIIDERWREHLFDVDYLREGIHLRGFVQIDPLVAYKNEAFTLFGDLINSIWADYARLIFNVQVQLAGRERRRGRRVAWYRPSPQPATPRVPRESPTPAAVPRWERARSPRRRPTPVPCRRRAAQYANGGGEEEYEMAPVVEQRMVDTEHTVGRNDPCWCGSGKKFKKCHGS